MLSPDVLKAEPNPEVDKCRMFEDRVRLVPISEWALPSRPYRDERYSRDPIPVGLCRISPATREVQR